LSDLAASNFSIPLNKEPSKFGYLYRCVLILEVNSQPFHSKEKLMAFQSAPGHGSLPNGNFSSVIYSKKTQSAFRKATVVGDITNSDYFGEISS
jgi:hypothetical protein